MPNSQRVASTFDSIGRRNEALRAQLDAIEFSFRNIETIRAQFHETLIPIDQILADIERTKLAHLEAERRFEELACAHEQLRSEQAGLTAEWIALTARREDLLAHVKDLERTIQAAEAVSSETRAALADRTAKLERTERELEDNRRRLHTVSDQLPALRAEFAAKEKRLQEVDRQRASLHDQNDLLAEENRTLRGRIEEFATGASKLNRQLSEVESRREDAHRRLDELEAALDQETLAHAKLKSAHFDAAETHRSSLSKLREELGAMSARSEAAERLLADARSGLRERDATIRSFEQRNVEHSLATKAKDAQVSDLEKDLAGLRLMHSEVDAARAAATERSAALAKAIESKDAAVQRAEQRIEALETKIAERDKTILGEREMYEEKIGKLKAQFEAESAALAFAEGALQSARRERGARLQDGDASPAPDENPAFHDESASDKIARLRG